MALSPHRVFPEADEWFAQRGYTRSKTREAIWSKTLPNGLILHFLTSADRYNSEIMDSCMGFVIQFPQLKKLQDSVYACLPRLKCPTGPLKATFINSALPHPGWTKPYTHLEATGSGPLWDQRFKELDHIIPTLEKEASTPNDIRPVVNSSKFYKINNRPFSEVFLALHDKDYTHAQNLLDTINGVQEVNPHRLNPTPEHPSFEEQFAQVKNIFTNYINTHS